MPKQPNAPSPNASALNVVPTKRDCTSSAANREDATSGTNIYLETLIARLIFRDKTDV